MNAFLKAQKVIFGVVAIMALLYGIILSMGFTVEFIGDYFQLSERVQQGLFAVMLAWVFVSFILTLVFKNKYGD